MPGSVKYNSALNCVEYNFTGITTGDEIHKATSEGIKLGKEYSTNGYLVDIREMVFEGPLTSLLDLPEKQYVEEKLDRFSRIALVMSDSEEKRKNARFYENASINRGWQVKCFNTYSDAVTWLTSKR